MAERPEVLVIGLGAYYRKLRAAIWTYLNPVALVDARAPEDLSLGPEEQPHFKQITKTKQLSTIVSSLSVPSMILTPNSLHTPNVVELASFGGPIFVEKPCAIKMSEIKSLEAVLSCHPSIYFSDFYLDVMSIPLLWFFGKVPLEDWRSNLIEGREQLALFEEIESWRANRIIGRILETDSIHRADWLVDPAQGGVLFDLLIHLLVVLWALFPHDDLVIDQVTLKDISGRNLRSVNLADAGAENYAAVLGHLPWLCP